MEKNEKIVQYSFFLSDVKASYIKCSVKNKIEIEVHVYAHPGLVLTMSISFQLRKRK